jgi:hypothetical protein
MASKPIEPEIEFDPRKDVENLKKARDLAR